MTISPGYTVRPRNAVVEFLTDLSRDAGLRAAFDRDPATVLNAPAFARLTDREKSLLAMRKRAAVVVAVTGEMPAGDRLTTTVQTSPVRAARPEVA